MKTPNEKVTDRKIFYFIRIHGGMIHCVIEVVVLQVQIDAVLLLGRVGAPRAAENLVPAVHSLVLVHVAVVLGRVVAQVAALEDPTFLSRRFFSVASLHPAAAQLLLDGNQLKRRKLIKMWKRTDCLSKYLAMTDNVIPRTTSFRFQIGMIVFFLHSMPRNNVTLLSGEPVPGIFSETCR